MSAPRRWADVPLMFGVTLFEQMSPFARNTIYLGLESGDIPGIKVGSKWVLSRDVIMEWMGVDPLIPDAENDNQIAPVVALESIESSSWEGKKVSHDR